jgi:hypothetical protein
LGSYRSENCQLAQGIVYEEILQPRQIQFVEDLETCSGTDVIGKCDQVVRGFNSLSALQRGLEKLLYLLDSDRQDARGGTSHVRVEALILGDESSRQSQVHVRAVRRNRRSADML